MQNAVRFGRLALLLLVSLSSAHAEPIRPPLLLPNPLPAPPSFPPPSYEEGGDDSEGDSLWYLPWLFTDDESNFAHDDEAFGTINIPLIEDGGVAPVPPLVQQFAAGAKYTKAFFCEGDTSKDIDGSRWVDLCRNTYEKDHIKKNYYTAVAYVQRIDPGHCYDKTDPKNWVILFPSPAAMNSALSSRATLPAEATDVMSYFYEGHGNSGDTEALIKTCRKMALKFNKTNLRVFMHNGCSVFASDSPTVAVHPISKFFERHLSGIISRTQGVAVCANQKTANSGWVTAQRLYEAGRRGAIEWHDGGPTPVCAVKRPGEGFAIHSMVKCPKVGAACRVNTGNPNWASFRCVESPPVRLPNGKWKGYAWRHCEPDMLPDVGQPDFYTDGIIKKDFRPSPVGSMVNWVDHPVHPLPPPGTPY